MSESARRIVRHQPELVPGDDGTLDDVPPRLIHPPLPSDEELARLYAEGNSNGSTLTYSQLAQVFGVSSSLVHRKVTQPGKPSGEAQREKQGRIRTNSRDPLVIEQGITRAVVNALLQAKENLGREGMLRVLATAEMYVGLRNPPDRT